MINWQLAQDSARRAARDTKLAVFLHLAGAVPSVPGSASHPKRRYPSQRLARGYTFVELMMAIAVMVIGLGGVIAMQQVTVSSNTNAKNVAMATHLAQAWLDELTAESGQWNSQDDFGDTVWLRTVGADAGQPAQWMLPAYDAARSFGPAFDALGNPLPQGRWAADAQYCTHLRLTWLNPQQRANTRGTGLIRAEVRVFWRRYGARGLTGAVPEHACDVVPANFDQPETRRWFHVVHLATALRQHSTGT